ncbi:MAG: hypothetical protein ABEK17_03370 [Candidatus Aenigmatarchaeota archaeon]
MKNSKISLLLLDVVLVTVIFSLTSWTINAETWQGEDIGDGSFSSIEMDSFGNPRISYYDNLDKDLLYAKWTKSGWEYETVDSDGDIGKYNSLVLDSNNNPHISYYDSTNRNLKYATEENDNWKVETIDSGDNVGLYSSIDLDNEGRPYISYYDFSKKQLKFAYRGVEHWKTETVDGEGDVGMYSSIRVNDQIHISYYNADKKNLQYCNYDGDSWTTYIVDQDNTGKYTSLTLDTSGNPHISYHGVNNGVVKHVFRDGEDWVSEIVDTEGSVGGDTSLKISEGKLHLAYSNEENSLVYAIKEGDWKSKIPDNSSFVSNDISIDVGMYGHVYMTYPDINTGKIKYLTYYTIPSNPLNLRAMAGDGNVRLQWIEPNNNGGKTIEEHYVYRIDPSGKEKRIASLYSPQTSYLDDSIVNGQNYQYYVTASNVIGESGRSNKVHAKPTLGGKLEEEESGETGELLTTTTILSKDEKKTDETIENDEIIDTKTKKDEVIDTEKNKTDEILPLYLVVPFIVVIILFVFKKYYMEG